MTRFWLSLEQGVRFTLRCIEQMQGGELFVPKIPSMHVVDLAKAIAPGSEIKVIGIRPGEKLHEILVSEDEARHTIEMDDMFVVQPPGVLWFGKAWQEKGQSLEEGFCYASNTNAEWLDVDQITEIVKPFEKQALNQAG
jgi:UDP-N-acetylglucosamine 4,6-dehydratase/5-epimerase